mmetsp:Transcript_109302/g.326904  ORF Transcript_109302/g.326904 Transcript_109302/m.326904 type:complete len:206 (+) Transcript_109302:436-1053(+)
MASPWSPNGSCSQPARRLTVNSITPAPGSGSPSGSSSRFRAKRKAVASVVGLSMPRRISASKWRGTRQSAWQTKMISPAAAAVPASRADPRPAAGARAKATRKGSACASASAAAIVPSVHPESTTTTSNLSARSTAAARLRSVTRMLFSSLRTMTTQLIVAPSTPASPPSSRRAPWPLSAAPGRVGLPASPPAGGSRLWRHRSRA